MYIYIYIYIFREFMCDPPFSFDPLYKKNASDFDGMSKTQEHTLFQYDVRQLQYKLTPHPPDSHSYRIPLYRTPESMNVALTLEG